MGVPWQPPRGPSLVHRQPGPQAPGTKKADPRTLRESADCCIVLSKLDHAAPAPRGPISTTRRSTSTGRIRTVARRPTATKRWLAVGCIGLTASRCMQSSSRILTIIAYFSKRQHPFRIFFCGTREYRPGRCPHRPSRPGPAPGCRTTRYPHRPRPGVRFNHRPHLPWIGAPGILCHKKQVSG